MTFVDVLKSPRARWKAARQYARNSYMEVCITSASGLKLGYVDRSGCATQLYTNRDYGMFHRQRCSRAIRLRQDFGRVVSRARYKEIISDAQSARAIKELMQ